MEISNLQNELKSVYVESKQARKESYLLFAGVIVLAILVMFTMFTSNPVLAVIVMIVILVFGIFYFNFKIAPRINAYESKVRNTVFPQVFAKHFSDVVYKPNAGLSKDLMKEYAIIDLGHDYDTEDYLEGSYNGVKFARADIETSTTTTTSNGQTTTTQTYEYFNGQVYQFDFHKSVDAYIRVREKGGFFSNSFERGKNVLGSFAFKTENQDFNKSFHAVTNNEQYAFYVFTPQFMEKVERLTSLIDGHLGVVITGQMLYIACYSKRNSFEFNASKEVDEEMLRNLESEIDIIKLVIDGLGLDSDLFRERE